MLIGKMDVVGYDVGYIVWEKKRKKLKEMV